MFTRMHKAIIPEHKLIEQLQRGDRAAFEALFRAYSAMVYNVCFRMLGNHQEAEDLTQDVFFKAYKSLKQFRAEAKLSTWLYRIATNLCLNHQRKKKQMQWLSLDFLGEDQGEQALASPEDSPDVTLEKTETERMVQNAINTLSKRQRIALILHRYEGLSQQEIAAILHCSVSSVESLLHRAKQNLYKRLLPFL